MFAWLKRLFTKSAPVKVEPLPRVNPRPPLEVVPPKEPGKVISLPNTPTDTPKSFFEDALAYVFPNEGELSNDAHDRGGMTKYGMIKADLKEWNEDVADGRIHPIEGMPLYFAVNDSSIKALTQWQAHYMYKWLYWDKIRLELITDKAKAICIFDIGVVRGRQTSIKTAQRICNALNIKVATDGKLGLLSAQAINGAPKEQFIRAFSADVSSQFKRIWMTNWTQFKFRNGWENRAKRLLTLLKYA